MSERGQQLLALLRANENIKPPPAVADPEWDPALIPEVTNSGHQKNPELDEFLDKIDILQAYEKWCGKMKPKIGSKRESIMVSCPNPQHPDKNPSAWINLDKDTYFCGACQQGGDKYTIAAYRHNFPIPGYQAKGEFPRLKALMAGDFGFNVVSSGGVETLKAQQPEPDTTTEHDPPDTGPAPVPKEEPAGESLASVIPLWGTSPTSTDVIKNASSYYIDWESFIPADTFLHSWMRAATIDDCPHEYYFFLGLQALAAAIGNNVVLMDNPEVRGNLFVCLYGPSASGKSRAMNNQKLLVEQALPYYAPDAYTPPTGVRLPGTPGSAEAMLDFFRFDLLDAGTNTVIDHASVNGLIKIDELAALTKRDMRYGSTFKETLIELFDTYSGDVRHKTKTGGEVVVRDPFAQIASGVQPFIVRDVLHKSDEHSGFLNRWVFAAGTPRVARIAYGVNPPDLNLPASMLSRIQLWAEQNKPRYELNGQALQAWEQHHNKRIVPIETSDESLLGRLSLNEKKLLVLFAANEMLAQPDASTISKATHLHDYMVSLYHEFGASVRETDIQRLWTDIEKMIRHMTGSNKTNSISRKQINQTMRRHYDGEQLNKAIEGMVKASILIEEKSTGNNPGIRYSLAGQV